MNANEESCRSLELERILECLFFVASEPLSVKKLAELSEYPCGEVERAVAQLAEEYQERGFRLRQIAGGWQFFTESEFTPLIEKLYRPKFQQLSLPAMETLAIIAYRQPVTRAEVSEIRQVDADSVIATLLDKKLIREVGRLDLPGRPILYGTSEQFLSFFGINSLDELPELPTGEVEPAGGGAG